MSLATLQALTDRLSPGSVVAGDDMRGYLADWRGDFDSQALAVFRPENARAVCEIVQWAGAAGIALVPQGGNTGLVGGSVAQADQCIVNLERMNRVIDIDTDNFSMRVEAGCTLQQVRDHAASANRLFALDLSSAGSCQIGGNIATNAGGVNVLRYGCARDQVLGLEAVTASGTVLNMNHALRKNVAGFDLKQLFIGAEGTLGIITGATLKLHAQPSLRTVCWVALRAPVNAVSLLNAMREQFGDAIGAFELIPDIALRFVTRHCESLKRPVKANATHVLIELHDIENDSAPLHAILADRQSELGIVDVVVASSARQAHMLWSIRHNISEAQRHEGVSLKHDVAVPVSQLVDFIDVVTAKIDALVAGVRPVVFGHLGDGNLHFNCSQPKSMSASEFRQHATAIAEIVHSEALACGGTVSAEHGIGLKKRDWLVRQIGSEAHAMMNALKQALDPDNMFNPGKVL